MYTYLGSLSLWMSLSLCNLSLNSTCCFNMMSRAYLRVRTCNICNFPDLESYLNQELSPL